MFKWSCFGLAAATLVGLGWMLNDLRSELKRATQSVNERLPEILDHTKKSTENLSKLAEDVKQLRNLAGIGDRPRDLSLSTYYDSLLDFIQASGGQIGRKRLIGNQLSSAEPAEEWVIAARKEALLRTTMMSAKNREQVLDILCNNWRGSDWYIQIEGHPPQKLFEWLKANHPETRDSAQVAEPEATK